MTVEASPMVDGNGNPFAPEAKRLMHTTMQTGGGPPSSAAVSLLTVAGLALILPFVATGLVKLNRLRSA